MSRTVPLSGTEAAFVQMVLEEHGALIRNADRRRDERMQVLLKEKSIPDGVHVRLASEDGVPVLTYSDPTLPPE